MPRINIEDAFWADPRRGLLIDLIGEDRAYSAVIRLWKLAQFYYKKGRLPIPASVFKASGLPEELITADLAVRREDGIYCRGAKDHFAWIAQRVGNAPYAGKRSAEARRMKSLGKVQPKSNRNEPNLNRNEPKSADPELPLDSPPPMKSLENVQPKSNPLLNTNTNTKNTNTLPSAAKNPPPPARTLFHLWNDHRGALPRALDFTKDRETKARACLAEKPDLEYWKHVITRMRESDFCTGKVPPGAGRSKPFVADFDFFLQPGTHARVCEGKYDNRSRKSAGYIVSDPLNPNKELEND